MKRKFLSIAVCLMFCLTSVFMLSACGKEDVTVVAQHEAEIALNNAMETLAQSTSIKMTMELPMDMGNMLIIASEEQSYVEMNMSSIDEEFSYEMNVSAWTEVEDDAFVTFAQMSMTEDGETEEMSTKTVSLMDDDVFENEYTEELFSGLDFDDFVKATEQDGEISIVFKDDEGSKFTAKIEDDKLVSIKMTSGIYSMTIYIHYGEFTSEIPELPEKDWQMLSAIEIQQIKDEYVQGEDIEVLKQSLIGLELEFYEDASNYEPDETFTINAEMLEKITITGFDATELTNGTPKQMTLTYLGIDFIVEYNVVAPVE